MSQYSHICRAWDGNRWMSFPETSHEEALDQARSLQDFTARDSSGKDSVTFLLIEVAETNARAYISHQWIGTSTGYKRVTGR